MLSAGAIEFLGGSKVDVDRPFQLETGLAIGEATRSEGGSGRVAARIRAGSAPGSQSAGRTTWNGPVA
jgi:hypothetical protein